MSDKDFVSNYLDDFSSLLKSNENLVNKLIEVKEILLDVKKNKSKVMIFGNGGSAAIASHVSVDLTKNAGIRCSNYNEADLITCFQMIMVMSDGSRKR
jgi:Phosphoheptose isomerase